LRSVCELEPALPMLKMLPALPMLRIDPALPMLSIEPALPMDSMEPVLPMLRMLPKLKMLPTLAKLKMLNKLLALSRPARLTVPVRDGVRFCLERADLRMVASFALGACSLARFRRGSLAAPHRGMSAERRRSRRLVGPSAVLAVERRSAPQVGARQR
jgi:hypothetical protein